MLTLKQATKNIAQHARRATPRQWKQGENWYKEAHQFCTTLARHENLTLESVAGCVAALSPQCSWSENLRNTLAMVKTRTLPETTAKIPVNVSKAFSIVHEGLHPLSVLGGKKVKAFYSNILDPRYSQAVTVDTHAIRAAFDIADLTRKQQDYGFLRGNAVIQQAYRTVARRYHVAPHKLQATVWLRVKADLLKKPEVEQLGLYIK